VDVRLINPFIGSIAAVFRTMVHVDVTIGKPHLVVEPGTRSDVSGVIGFSGQASGCVVLSFPMDVACRVTSCFAGAPLNEKHPDFADAVGELANMVAGNAKKDFEGMDISISLPSVIVGADHLVSKSQTCPRLVIPVESSLGSFDVEVSMVMARNEKAAPVGNVTVCA
jgi:chemotaxis protein CheX